MWLIILIMQTKLTQRRKKKKPKALQSKKRNKILEVALNDSKHQLDIDLELKKNINGFNLGFNIKDDLANSCDYKEANFTLNKVF